MIVYVLSKYNSWELLKILGVFEDIDKAKQFANDQEPDKDYSWAELSSSNRFFDPKLFTGPVYRYDIDEFEVQE